MTNEASLETPAAENASVCLRFPLLFPGMRLRTKVIGVLLCSLLMYAYLCLSVTLQFVNFKPSDVTEDTAPLYEKLTRRAELGATMHQPFLAPMQWFTKATGGMENQGVIKGLAVMGFFSAIHWMVLPIVYGTLLFIVGCQLFRFGRWLLWREPEPSDGEWVP